MTMQWWSSLDPQTQTWLAAHNGEPLPPEILAEVELAAGPATSDAAWLGETGSDGMHLSDEAVDSIEAWANGE